MGLSFRHMRKLWLVLMALVSLTCIIISMILWEKGYCKDSSLAPLLAIPLGSVIGVLWSTTRKQFKQKQMVCLEITWISSMVPFQIVLGLFAMGLEVPSSISEHTLYSALIINVWLNCTFAFSYATSLVLLSIFTHLSYDKDVWSRDLDSSPSPFPMVAILVFAFPCLAPREDCREQGLQCLPGCACATKLSQSSSTYAEPSIQDRPEDVLKPEGTVKDSQLIPVQVPTSMDRRNVIVVEFGA